MSTQNEYLMLFRGTDWFKGLSPEEMQRVAGATMEWFKRLTAAGKAVGGHPLEAEGKVVSGKGGRIVSDGPFAESKEAIGGYIMLQAGSLDEAVEIAKDFPALAHGAQVEVRPVAEECPAARMAAGAELAGTAA